MVAGGVVHYVGSGQIARADHAECDAQVAGIVAYHERNGYKTGGAYNVHRCQHGGRWLHYLGPNQASGDTWANLNLHAICAVIGDGDEPSAALLTGIAEELDMVPGARQDVSPHSRWFNTSCCGDPLRAWVAAGAFAPDAIPTTGRIYDMFIAVGRTVFGVALGFLVTGGRVLRTFGGAEGLYGIPQTVIDWKSGDGRDAVPLVFVDADLVAQFLAPWPTVAGGSVTVPAGPLKVTLTGTAVPVTQ